MSRVRIVFLGTPDFAVTALEGLIVDEHFEIVAVVTQPDRPAGRKMQLKRSPVRQVAEQHGLRVFAPETVNTPEFCEQMRALTPESAVVVAFGQILKDDFMKVFPQGCVNVHGSLLPKWRGAAPIQRSIMNGDVETGVTLQLIVKKLDAGAILGKRQISLSDELTAVEVYGELKKLGAELLHVEYMDYLRGNLTATPQDEALVTFAPKIDKSEARIDWQKPARVILNQIRGLALGPQTFTTRSGQALKILVARVESESGFADGSEGVPAGQVTSVGDDYFVVACASGQLRVLLVQPESRKPMAVKDYLLGHPLKKGERLGV